MSDRTVFLRVAGAPEHKFYVARRGGGGLQNRCPKSNNASVPALLSRNYALGFLTLLMPTACKRQPATKKKRCAKNLTLASVADIGATHRIASLAAHSRNRFNDSTMTNPVN